MKTQTWDLPVQLQIILHPCFAYALLCIPYDCNWQARYQAPDLFDRRADLCYFAAGHWAQHPGRGYAGHELLLLGLMRCWTEVEECGSLRGCCNWEVWGSKLVLPWTAQRAQSLGRGHGYNACLCLGLVWRCQNRCGT